LTLKTLYLTRTEYDPVGVFGNLLIDPITGKFLYKFKLILEDLFRSPQKNHVSKPINEDKTSTLEKLQEVWPLSARDSLLIQKRIELIKEYATNNHSEEIFLIDIPMNSKHYTSEKMQYIKNLTSEIARTTSNINFIPANDYSNYSTSDGSHLDRSSAIKYVRYLEKRLN